MQIKKTHIFMKYNPYPNIGGSRFSCINIHECIIPSNNLTTSSRSFYFKEIGGSLTLITQSELDSFQKDTEEAIQYL
jgi:hypothetical protein